MKFYAAIPVEFFVYLILELCMLGDLSKFFKDQGRVSFERILKFMKDLGNGLDYLHTDRGILHRDLKPGNILVKDEDSGYYLAIADFGLSKFLSGSSTPLGNDASAKIGTPGWRAPEIPLLPDLGFRYTPYIDIFSLGLLYLSMLKHRYGRSLMPLMSKYNVHYSIQYHTSKI